MILAVNIKPYVGGCWTRARILHQLMEWQHTTNLKDIMGRAVMIPLLKNMARRIGVQTPAISKVMRWLADQGYIAITKIKIGRSWRLQIRLLIRLRKPSGNPQGNRQETLYLSDTSKSLIIPSRGTTAPEIVKMVLRGPIEGAADRIKEKREQAQKTGKDKPPTPLPAAHEWVRLLGEYGYRGFYPNDLKHLKAISKTIELVGAPTLKAFTAEIERRMGLWQNQRPDHLGKAPPHPWAINRTNVLFQPPEPTGEGTEDDYDYGALPTYGNNNDAQALSPAAIGVDDAKKSSQVSLPMLAKKNKGGLMHLFNKTEDTE